MSNYSVISTSENGYSLIKSNNKCGILYNQRVIVEPIYDELLGYRYSTEDNFRPYENFVWDNVSTFRFKVVRDGKVGFLNSEGKEIVPCIYNDAGVFYGGYYDGVHLNYTVVVRYLSRTTYKGKSVFNSELRVIDLYGNFVSNAITFVNSDDDYTFFLGRGFLLLQARGIKEEDISRYKPYSHLEFSDFLQDINVMNEDGNLLRGNTIYEINREGKIVDVKKTKPFTGDWLGNMLLTIMTCFSDRKVKCLFYNYQ